MKKVAGLKCPKCGQLTLYRSGANRPGGKLRYRCGGDHGTPYCYGTTDPTKPVRNQAGKTTSAGPRTFLRAVPSATRYIITAAQNATPVHEGFLAALQRAAKYLKAELVIIPLRYKNPTSSWTESQANADVWHVPNQLLFSGRKKLNANLVLVGDVKVQPTAASPLTGFEGLTHSESCILGHPKIQLKVVPVAAGKYPKILTTTGVCTLRNYTDSKAGKLGEFHHSLGATLVEIDDKKFHLRQIVGAKDGSFIDLTRQYDADGVYTAAPALGLVMGDLHHRFLAPGVRRATFDAKDSMVNLLQPNTLVFHDILDGHTHNPHHDGNPFIEAAKQRAGMDDVRHEVAEAVAFADLVTAGRNGVIVPDNHGDFLRRWIVKSDWRELSTASNKAFYLETAQAMLASAKMGPGGVEYDSAFAYWAKRLATNPGLRILNHDESFTVGRFEAGMHGHQGPNGSRGSIKNLSRLGSLVISGHGHTPGWEEGHRRVGVSTGKLEYEGGPSSHLQTHCTVYASGASCLLTVIDDRWCVG